MNTEPKNQKGQFSITNKNSTVSGNTASFSLPYQVDYNKICLEAASFTNTQPNSNFNISAFIGNNKFNYGSISLAGYGSGVTLTIPDGLYTPTTLCAYLNPLIVVSGNPVLYLTYNSGTNTITITNPSRNAGFPYV